MKIKKLKNIILLLNNKMNCLEQIRKFSPTLDICYSNDDKYCYLSIGGIVHYIHEKSSKNDFLDSCLFDILQKPFCSYYN